MKYKPESHSDNRMQHEGDVERARNYFFSEAPLNLKFLLEKRFSWMNDYISSTDNGIEVGCGTGLSKLFIKNNNFKITDYADHEWLDQKMVDALKTPYPSASLDFVVSSNMIHHVPYPVVFFEEMNRVLKPGGVFWELRRSLKN